MPTLNQGQQPRRRTTASSQPRTRAITGRRRASALACSRRPAAAQARLRPRSRLRQALHFRLQLKFQNGLHLHVEIGPALLGVILGIVVAVWWPELKPLLSLI